MWVIPLILSEEMTEKLPEEILIQLAECSTSIIKKRVKNYLNSMEANKEIQAKVYRGYSFQIAIEEFLQDTELAKKVNLIKDLEYYNISPHLSMTELEAYQDAILSIINNKFAIPYIAPISGVLIKDLTKKVHNLYKSTKSNLIKEFYECLKGNTTLFRDSQFQGYKGTIVKKIIRNRTKYTILLRGVEFMIEKKKQQALPMSWRYL
ncbi:MAG: hypothetical protein HFI05_02080 [Lachnospiraceae bacterium]|jgi:hypothetical protein|nr:hypothetical protein [Lachnospiraceae bacterium]